MRSLLAAAVVVFASFPALAWDVRKDSEGDIVTWTHPVVMTLDANAAKLMHEPRAEAAIRAAVKNLDDATPGLSFTVVNGAPQPIGYQLDSDSNTNSILALEDWPYSDDALAVTLVTLNARTNEILDADVAFNISSHEFRVLVGDAAQADVYDDVQNTITHELGHVLGLMHSAMETDLVMYPSAPPGEVSKRELKEDDRAGLLSLYAKDVATTVVPDPVQTGCSTSGWLVLLVPLALLLLRRPAQVPVPVPARRRNRRSGLLALLLVPAFARAADDVVPIDADSAAVMEVTAQRSAFHPLHKGLIVTTLTLETRACLRGACAGQQSIVVPGGRVGDLEQQIVDLPVPATGERLVISVKAGRAQIHRDLKSIPTRLPLQPRVTVPATTATSP